MFVLFCLKRLASTIARNQPFCMWGKVELCLGSLPVVVKYKVNGKNKFIFYDYFSFLYSHLESAIMRTLGSAERIENVPRGEYHMEIAVEKPPRRNNFMIEMEFNVPNYLEIQKNSMIIVREDKTMFLYLHLS